MAFYYLDASALVKRYVAEKGTAFITSLTNPNAGNDVWIAAIGSVELVAALYRRVNTGSIGASQASNAEQAFRGDLVNIFNSVDLTPSILSRAMGLAKLHLLRAYDAIQLATALELQVARRNMNLPSLIFLCADQTLNQAALAEGPIVDDPNRYP
jgi:predicted nucleic acid-binding protein